MAKPNTFSVLANIAILLVLFVSTVGPSHAAGAGANCLTKPDSTAPRGHLLVSSRGSRNSPSMLVLEAQSGEEAPGRGASKIAPSETDSATDERDTG